MIPLHGEDWVAVMISCVVETVRESGIFASEVHCVASKGGFCVFSEISEVTQLHRFN
jgi:hypothetical protein